ncbi:transcriptional regulator XRE family protein [Nanobdella aerobiophila]|uniref:Transcriptional regulator XRE family protein n=1 Tax=Nanobdella aerobiophila TaxID=2586965 RepID=A0A915SCJ6_9ARCH|nr:multiprotein-bridging factor 1 family protein [Nanobdella aerobiophila]BBL45448.1 transcriptional regulator XRE family protein [Nanobdella aerobiophila]
MKTCELCGKNTERLYRVLIENSILKVCIDCKRYGKEVDENNNLVNNKNTKVMEIVSEVIDEDYNKLLIKYREENNLKQEDMARKLNMKESLYKAIENKKIMPDINTAKKIEKELNIKIIKKEVLTENNRDRKNHDYVTVGDIIDFEE